MAYLVFRRRLTIEWGHCDPAGIVFNSRYFEYFDWSTTLLFQAALGFGKPELQAKFDADMPLVDARAKFLRPASYGDEVEIASTIGEFRRSSFDVQHRLSKDGELAVEGVETRVWVGRDPSDPAQFRAKRLPAELIDAFRASS
jgi:4-hydroxybenzoyl-CoA thioesterase